ncbi:TPD domain-containing protein [Geoglobus ahangari]
MRSEEFFKIRRDLKRFSDFKNYPYPRGTLFSILLQKRIDNVKRRYHVYTAKLPELAAYWEKHHRIPEWLRLPPVMRIKLLMKSLGMTNKEISKNFSNPDESEFSELVWSAIYKDFIYSPIAVRYQFARGRVGEEIIREHLESLNVEFKDENQLRPAKKTPDFYIEDGIEVEGRKIRWIESKALFGDIKLHRFYSKKQYDQYLEMYGDGMVIYWLGKIDELNSLAMLKDYRFIESPSKRFLVEMKVYLANRNAEELAESLNTEVFEWKAEEMRSTEFLKDVMKLFDSVRSNIVVANWNRDLRAVLRNMGLLTVVV